MKGKMDRLGRDTYEGTPIRDEELNWTRLVREQRGVEERGSQIREQRGRER